MAQPRLSSIRGLRIQSLALLLCFGSLVSCGGVFSPKPPEPQIPSPAEAAQQCGAICDRLTLLRCDGWQGNAGPDEAQGTPDDVSCQTACVEVQAVVALNANCVVEAGSCSAVEDCGN
jgi:hypothetical protein